LLGIGFLIANSGLLLIAVKILGSDYFIDIGHKSLDAKPISLIQDEIQKNNNPFNGLTAFC